MKPRPVAMLASLFLAPILAHAGGNGKLSITIKPKAVIYVDGQPMGNAFVKGLSVAPGSHNVKYESKELGQSTEFVLVISSDKHMKCDYSFENGEHRCTEESTKAPTKKTTVSVEEPKLDGPKADEPKTDEPIN